MFDTPPEPTDPYVHTGARGVWAAGDAEVRFLEDGETTAVATVGRARAGLEPELELGRLWARPAAAAEVAG